MIKFIIKSLIRDFGQYLLATVGLVIGITSLISMGYLGIVGKIKLFNEIKKQGVNIVYIYPESVRKTPIRKNFAGLYPSIKNKEITYVSSLPFHLEKSLSVKYFTTNVKYGRNYVNGCEIISSKGNYLKFFNYEIIKKIPLNNPLDGCFIGYTVFKELFNENFKALGKYINIGGKFVKIVGVIAEKGASSSGRDLDKIVIIPLKLFTMKFQNKDYFDAMYVKPVKVEFIKTLKQSIIYILKSLNNNLIFPLKDFKFSVRSMDYYIKKQEKVGIMMIYSTFIVSSITLLVGGIGIMAIMLILAIKETREIGIKRSLGATKFYIFFEYMVKSVSIAVIASFLGVSLGVVSYFIINKIYDVHSVFPIGYAVTGIISAFAISLLFGVYPAYKASKIEPSTALHSQ